MSLEFDRTWDEAQHQRGVVVTNCWFEASLVEERVISRYDHFLYKPMKTIPIEGTFFYSTPESMNIDFDTP